MSAKLYHCPIVDEDIPNKGDCPHISSCNDITPECFASLCEDCIMPCEFVSWRVWKCARHRANLK